MSKWSVSVLGLLVLFLAACGQQAPLREDFLEIQATGAMIWPTTGSANSVIGMRKHPITGVWKPHRGRDIAAPTGTAVYAAYSGQIIYAGYQAGGAGNYIKIKHASGYETLYMHLSSFVRTSGSVNKGDLIGRVGSTGGSTGPHLHFEVRRYGTYIDWDNGIPYGTRVTAKTPIPYNFSGLSGGGQACTWPVVRQSTQRNILAHTVQFLLKERGYNLVADAIYGTSTYKTVVDFQYRNGLTRDGVVGPQTWAKLIITAQLNSTGNEVIAIQNLLHHRHRYTALAIDGKFGSGTRSTVIAFQRSKGLPQDGVVGPATWAALVGNCG